MKSLRAAAARPLAHRLEPPNYPAALAPARELAAAKTKKVEKNQDEAMSCPKRFALEAKYARLADPIKNLNRIFLLTRLFSYKTWKADPYTSTLGKISS